MCYNWRLAVRGGIQQPGASSDHTGNYKIQFLPSIWPTLDQHCLTITSLYRLVMNTSLTYTSITPTKKSVEKVCNLYLGSLDPGPKIWGNNKHCLAITSLYRLTMKNSLTYTSRTPTKEVCNLYSGSLDRGPKIWGNNKALKSKLFAGC